MNVVWACVSRHNLSARHGHRLPWTHQIERSGIPWWSDYAFKEMWGVMSEIRDFVESQKEHICCVWGEPSWTHHCQKWDQVWSGLGLDYYTDPSPNQQESDEILLWKDKLPPKLHLKLSADRETHVGHDQEGCNIQLGQEGKVHIHSYQIGYYIKPTLYSHEF